MKLSKGAKARIKMMSATDRKKVASAARLLAESECITMPRANAIIRWTNKGGC